MMIKCVAAILYTTAEDAMKTLGVDHIDVVADGGYFAIEDIQACAALSISQHIPKPNRSPAARKGLFTKKRLLQRRDKQCGNSIDYVMTMHNVRCLGRTGSRRVADRCSHNNIPCVGIGPEQTLSSRRRWMVALRPATVQWL